MAAGPDPRQALGEAARERRLQAGLSQREVARRCGAHRSWVSNLERGRANPTLSKLHALAVAIDVPLAALVALAEEIQRDAGQSRRR